jgi:hypothetical protein
MKTFEVYKHPALGSQSVKIGFNWPAFFFGFFWMLFSKLWGKAGLWFVMNVIASLIEAAADRSTDEGSQAIIYLSLFIAYFALWLIPGFKGNKWRSSNLTSRGFELVTRVEAETKDAAIAKESNGSIA